jgi:hypothetical protein
MNKLEIEKQLIADLGGAQAVARLLGLNDHTGRQTVHNWLSRGIPEILMLKQGKMLLKLQRRALRKQALAQQNIVRAAIKS